MSNVDLWKESISSIVHHPAVGAEFFFMVDTVTGRKLFKADLESSAQENLKSMFIDAIEIKLLINQEIMLKDFSKADERSNLVARYDLPEMPSDFDMLKNASTNKSIELFNFKEMKMSEIKGMVILIGNSTNKLSLYKHFYPISLIKKNSGLTLGNFGNHNRLEELNGEILKVNSNFDFITVNGEIYMLNLEVAEKFYGLDLIIKNVAKISFAAIKESQLVMDLKFFESCLVELTFARKLIRSSKNSIVLRHVENSAIIKFARTHRTLKSKFKFNSELTKFDLSTKESIKLFFKILNDDYLFSNLTGNEYESLAKDDLPAAE